MSDDSEQSLRDSASTNSFAMAGEPRPVLGNAKLVARLTHQAHLRRVDELAVGRSRFIGCETVHQLPLQRHLHIPLCHRLLLREIDGNSVRPAPSTVELSVASAAASNAGASVYEDDLRTPQCFPPRTTNSSVSVDPNLTIVSLCCDSRRTCRTRPETVASIAQSADRADSRRNSL